MQAYPGHHAHTSARMRRHVPYRVAPRERVNVALLPPRLLLERRHLLARFDSAGAFRLQLLLRLLVRRLLLLQKRPALMQQGHELVFLARRLRRRRFRRLQPALQRLPHTCVHAHVRMLLHARVRCIYPPE